MRKTRVLVLVGILCGPAAGFADDTDIFLTAPGGTGAAGPNVLIVLDNSANWSASFSAGTKFAAERTALSNVIGNLSTQVNVGLMMMDETGAGTTAPTTGSYVRFGVRNMDATNRAWLRNLILNLGINNDKTNNASWGFGMFEVYKYFGGGNGSPKSPTYFGNTAYSGFGQPKRDFPNNPSNAAGGVPGHAFDSALTRVYNSPIDDGCQKNYIIFIGNGMPQSGADGGNPSAATLLANVGGSTATIPLPSTGAQSNIADEYARFLSQTDVSSQAGRQGVLTYTIAVYNPAQMTGSDPDMITLMTSMASQGGGRYFAATDATTLQRALETIFTEVQAVNSVFASSTLPVSVNVRGTYLNQVYMGVFRPDADALPRWMGNLKEYRLAVSGADTLFMADVNGQPVENTSTGFVSPSALSYWTSPSTYWGFRPSGIGGASDSPDGDIVEKGAAAQVLRSTYAASQASRKVYTCTDACPPGSRLADTPFDDVNTGITQGALGAATAAERTRIIEWVRGQDLFDENLDANVTDVRASIHGDVLHSRPGVVNYNRTGNNNDIVVFYGGNDGLLHAVTGGQGGSGGTELWSFVAPEFFPKLKRLYDNGPKISSIDPRPYFFDGMIGTWYQDVDKDGVLSVGDGDKVYLYVSARRGGRLLYALDVSDPDNPLLLWRAGCPNPTSNSGCSPGYDELGQTWSLPQPVKLRYTTKPVLLMGAGYDNIANDAMPQGPAAMGRGIMAIDGLTGDMIWQAGPAPAGSSYSSTVGGMLYSIASDLMVLDRNADGYVDRIYAPDTGGNVWRVDTHDNDPANWTVTRLATLGGTGADARKFLYPPDVVFASDSQNYDAVLIGSGDREHPFDTTVANRFYMLKDTNIGLTGTDLAITESSLYDASANLIQDGTATQQASATTALTGAQGWSIALLPGEKVVGNAVTLAGTTYFGTNRPTPAADGVCTPNLGEARLYALSFKDGSATMENNASAGLTLGDRSRVRAGGGYPPSFVPISVSINNKIYQGVVSGTQVLTAPVQAGKRKRTFWFLELDK